MKKIILSFGLWAFCLLAGVKTQDVLFSFSINNTDPINSIVNIYAEFDGSGNSNAFGYALRFYYDATEATNSTWNFAPTTALGWNTSGNATYSNNPSSNPLVLIEFTNVIEVQVFDGNEVGTNFSTTPTLIATLTFNKDAGVDGYGGEVFAGASADTDPGIEYLCNVCNPFNPPIQITGNREGLLPISLIAFNAEKFNERNSFITWSTSSEINSSLFNIERSIDQKTWANVGKVIAAGNSQIIQNYEFIDENVYNGLDARLNVYYRLEMVDLDGQRKLSPIKNVLFGNSLATGREISVYPNPSSEGLQIEWEADRVDQPTQIEFFDVKGKLVYSKEVAEHTNQEYIDFGKTSIQPGLYILRILSGTEAVEHKQIVVTDR